MRHTDRVRPIFYVNGDVENRIKDCICGSDNKYVARFRDIPIRCVDEIRSDEARV
jgi:hypothetical protein